MKNTILFSAIIACIILGCQKKNTTPTTPTPPTTINNNTTVKESLKWHRVKQSVTYEADGVTEASRQEYTYDAEGRCIGYKFYSKGLLNIETRNYVYSGNECTSYTDYYTTSGTLYSTSKAKTLYNND